MNTVALDIKFTQRFPMNLISNIAYFVLNILIGLALVPFFLNALGTSAYGLIPLATSITAYITFIIDALNTSVSRFLTIDLQRSDERRANETFNTALFGTLGIILILMPIALAAAWYAPALFNIGDQSAIDVFLLFSLIFGSILIRAWSSNFMVILFAYNKLDKRNYVYLANLFTQLLIVVTLFLCQGPSLVFVGISYVGGAIVSLLLAFILSKRTYPKLKISPAFFIRSRLKEIGGMSTWVVINHVGFLLNTQVALFLVNILFGDVAGTEYSLAVLWSTLLISIASLITNLFTPMIYAYYSKQDRDGLVRFSSMTIKSVGLIMALPIALVCIFSPQLLTIWVGEEFAHLSLLIWVCIPPIILQTMISCIIPIIFAYNRIRSLVSLTLPLGFLNVVLALLLPYAFDVGMYGIAIAGLITFILRFGLVNPIFTANLLQIPLATYLKEMLYGIGGLILISIAGIIFLSLVNVSTLPSLILASFVIAIVYLFFVIIVALNPEEKEMVRSCLPVAWQRRIPSWLL